MLALRTADLRAGICRFRAFAHSATDRESPLHALNTRHGARFVPFAGYRMPLQFDGHTIRQSHRQCRRSAALFDVSHMQQTRISGPHALAFVESLGPVDARALLERASSADAASALSVLTNADGGIVDDLIVTVTGEQEVLLVTNAGRRTEDARLLAAAERRFAAAGRPVRVDRLDSDDRALVALQGPRAMRVLQALLPADAALRSLAFMRSRVLCVAGVTGRVSRCGYTGEDGFELSLPADRAEHVCEALLAERRTAAERDADRRAAELDSDDGDADAYGAVRLAGLGARDTLRLEAGMCLYGAELDERTGPAEAGLGWLVAQRRRAERNWPGAEEVARTLSAGVGALARRRIGLRLDAGGPAARAGAPIGVGEGQEWHEIGTVTSGAPSPTLGVPVAMGYVRGGPDAVRIGDRLQVRVRGKTHGAQVVKMPFVATRYYVQ